jgi:hypothetical protein
MTDISVKFCKLLLTSFNVDQSLINNIRPSKNVNPKFQSHFKGLPAFNVFSVNSLSSIEAQRNNPVLKWSEPQKITETKKWFKIKLTLKICWIKIWNILYSQLKRMYRTDITSV